MTPASRSLALKAPILPEPKPATNTVFPSAEKAMSVGKARLRSISDCGPGTTA